MYPGLQVWWEDENPQAFTERAKLYEEELFPREGSQAVEQMPRGVVQSLPLEVIRTQMDTD